MTNEHSSKHAMDICLGNFSSFVISPPSELWSFSISFRLFFFLLSSWSFFFCLHPIHFVLVDLSSKKLFLCLKEKHHHHHWFAHHFIFNDWDKTLTLILDINNRIYFRGFDDDIDEWFIWIMWENYAWDSFVFLYWGMLSLSLQWCGTPRSGYDVDE